MATLFVTASVFTLATAAPAFAAPVSLGSVSLPDASGIAGSATANAASIVGSFSAPDTSAPRRPTWPSRRQALLLRLRSPRATILRKPPLRSRTRRPRTPLTRLSASKTSYLPIADQGWDSTRVSAAVLFERFSLDNVSAATSTDFCRVIPRSFEAWGYAFCCAGKIGRGRIPPAEKPGRA